MTNYIIRRLIQTVVVTIILSYVCYDLMTLMPGDPVDLMIQSNPRIKPEDVARLKTLYGLDQPAYVRYWHWAQSTVGGDLGYSRTYRIPVNELIGPKLWNTFILSMASLVLSLIVAIPLGVLSALGAGTKVDYWINFFAFAGISVPPFWLAIMLILTFAVTFKFFPAGGTFTIGHEDGPLMQVLADRLRYIVLPTCSLAYLSIGRFLRFTRSAMLEAMRNDYIRTAKAKGLSYSRVIWAHGFRNALLPLITIIALSFSGLFSGALITESVFAYQGVGKLFYDSMLANDYNVAMVSFMISIIMVLIFNLIADILYAMADPRISYK